ncbi:hypothetical protein NMY22_g18578 [Coprinellus aureogranulatus]|nr:hypothetical protein NMY22_g18578 [Coprinellus aureogranulatus]
MSVLDRAARFASSPRDGKRVQIYLEDPFTREFTVRADDHLVYNSTQQASPTADPKSLANKASSSSMLSLPQTSPEKVRKRRTLNFGSRGLGSASSSATSSAASSPASSVLSLHSNTSTASSTLTSTSSAKPLALAQVASGTRPFDTLIHYILGPPSASTSSSGSGSLSPPGPQSQSAGGSSKHVPEKILLKQAILVTTLSAPYLAVPPEPPANLRLGSSSKRSSTIRSRTNSSYDAGSLGSMTKKNMAASKSMPEGMGHKRRDTMPPIPPLPPLSPSSEETTEGESLNLNPSKSTSSFKSLKKRFTLSRRSSYVPEVPHLPSHTSDDGHSTTTTAGRSSGTTKKRFSLSLGSRSNRSSILTPNPDDVAAQLEAYSRLQTSSLIRRYAGRSHIVHVLCEPADYVVSPSLSASSPSVSPTLSGGSVKGKSRASTVVPIAPRRPGALVKGIEQFLVAFAYPVQGISASLSSSSSSRSATPPSPARSPVLGAPATLEGRRDETKPVPFVLRGGTLGAVFSLPGSSVTGSTPGVGESPQQVELGGGGEEEKKASVAECVMFGALDGGERHGAWKAWLDVGGEVLLGDGGLRVKMEGRGVDEMLGFTSLPPSPSSGSGSYPPIAGKGLPRAAEMAGIIVTEARVTGPIGVDVKTGSDGRRNLSGHGGYGERGHRYSHSHSVVTAAGGSSPSSSHTSTSPSHSHSHSHSYSPSPTTSLAPTPFPSSSNPKTVPVSIPVQSPVHLSPPLPSYKSHNTAPVRPAMPLTPQSSSSTSTSSMSPPFSSPPPKHSSLSPPPLSGTPRHGSAIPRTVPLSTVDERYRQPVVQPKPDLKFHLPKTRSGVGIRAEWVDGTGEFGELLPASASPDHPSTSPDNLGDPEVIVEQDEDEGRDDRERRKSGRNESVATVTTTGLLTPPESRASVSSEEDLVGGCEEVREQGDGVSGGISDGGETTASPPGVVVTEKRPESFDFVKAYMYDVRRSGSTGSSPGGSPEVVQHGKEEWEQAYVRQRSLSTVVEARRDAHPARTRRKPFFVLAFTLRPGTLTLDRPNKGWRSHLGDSIYLAELHSRMDVSVQDLFICCEETLIVTSKNLGPLFRIHASPQVWRALQSYRTGPPENLARTTTVTRNFRLMTSAVRLTLDLAHFCKVLETLSAK